MSDVSWPTTIGDRCRMIRSGAGLTQMTLAAEAGLESPNSVRAFEAGRAVAVRLSLIEAYLRLARRAGVSPAYALGLTDQARPEGAWSRGHVAIGAAPRADVVAVADTVARAALAAARLVGGAPPAPLADADTVATGALAMRGLNARGAGRAPHPDGQVTP